MSRRILAPSRRNRKLQFETMERRDLLSISPAPLFSPASDLYHVQEDQAIVIGPEEGLLANDPSEVTSAVLVEGPSHGQLFLNPNGAFAYHPDEDFVGEDSFVYRSGDGSPEEVATVQLLVGTDTSGTTAADDSYQASKNRDLDVGVNHGLLANDVQIRFCELVASPAHGTLVLGPNGSFKYTPQAGYVGDDVFRYRGIGTEGADIGEVTIHVANDAPVAVDDAYEVTEDSTLDVSAVSGILANDTDLNGDSLTGDLLEVVTTPQHGTLSMNPDGSFLYTPDAQFAGTDSFTYKAFDGELYSAVPATVTITVKAVNDRPQATALEGLTTAEDTPLAGTLAGEDGDPEFVQTLTFTLAAGPEHGTVAIDSATGEFIYTPDANYNGPDRFSFAVTDDDQAGASTALTSEAAWVSITVTSVNDQPVAIAPARLTTVEDSPVTGTLAGEDGDPEVAQTLTFAVVGEPIGGTVILNAETGVFQFTPNVNYTGSDAGFYFTVTDGQPEGLTSVPAWVPITVTPVNDRPVAIAVDDVTTDEDTAVTGALTGDDGDPEVAQTLTFTLIAAPEHGTVSIDAATGEFTYTPALNYHGPDRFSFTVTDDAQAGDVAALTSEAAWVSITVNAVADPVVAEPDTYVTGKDTALIVLASEGLLANDSDTDGDAVAAVLTLPEHGDLILQADGSFGYMPDEGYTGEDSFTYLAGNSLYVSVATATITVDAIPVAADDAVITDQDTPITLPASGVLSNDADGDLETLTAVLGTGPTNGTVVLNADGSFTYTPNAGFTGADSFTYQAYDGRVYSNEATVTITVNAKPVAEGDEVRADQDTPVTIPMPGVLGNDSPNDSDTLTALLASGPAHGTLALDANGSFTYTPNAGFYGEDSFTYRAYDGRIYSDEATVTITVNATPVAVNDTAITDQNTSLTLSAATLLNNDSDQDSLPLTVQVASQPKHGTLVANGDGSLTYTPSTDFSGEDAFTYRAFDGRVYSNEATVTITVNAIPVAVGGMATTDQDTAITVAARGVLGSDTDAFWGTLTARLVDAPNHGTVVLNSDGSFTYTPNAGFTGADTFTYQAYDGRAYSNVATMSITVNAKPEAEGDAVMADQDTPVEIPAPGVLGNDSAGDEDTLTAVLVGEPKTAHGTVVLNADGSFTYTPDEGFYGEDSFAYQAYDGRIYSDVATVTITVNARPVANDDAVITDQDTPLVLWERDALANDTDAFWGTLSIELASQPEHGTLTFNEDGSATYTPEEGFYGEDSFTYRVNDGRIDDEATVTITVNAIPGAGDDEVITDQDTPLIVDVSGDVWDDYYWDDDRWAAEVVGGGGPTHGTVSANADGTFTYTPDAGFSGEDWFTYRAFDGHAYSNEAAVAIIVNAKPVAMDDTASTDQNTPLVVSWPGVLDDVVDDNWDELTAELVSGPTSGAIVFNADGSFTYTPNAGFSGVDTFTYRAYDGRVYSNNATITITVNDASRPSASEDEYVVLAGGILTVAKPGPLSNDTSPSGNPLRMVVLQRPSNYTFFSWAGSGQFVYQPRSGFAGVDTFTYQVTDGALVSTPTTVRITVLPEVPRLTCSEGPVEMVAAAAPSQEELCSMLEAAIARWVAAGVPTAIAIHMAQLKVTVCDLPGKELARVTNRAVYLDGTAAGHGWFLDATPDADEEFAKAERELRAIDPQAVDQIDLLSVLTHELGHVAGLPDLESSDDGLMSGSLGRGLRRLPGEREVDVILAAIA